MEAQLLKDYLASHHIQTVIQGEYLSGAAGELPALQFPVLWVLEDEDLERGKELIGYFFQNDKAAIPWVCPACGEHNEGQFHICWNCAKMK